MAKSPISKTPTLKPQAVAALQLGSQLCFALYSTSLAMTRLYRPLLSALGITYPQYLVLLALWARDGVTVSELGAQVSLDSGTLTPLLQRMQSLGLVKRTRNSEDERQVLVTLTSKGDGLRDKADGIHTHIACATGCTSSERKQLNQSLQRLRASLLVNAA